MDEWVEKQGSTDKGKRGLKRPLIEIKKKMNF
jgi:hypothetical protein